MFYLVYRDVGHGALIENKRKKYHDKRKKR